MGYAESAARDESRSKRLWSGTSERTSKRIFFVCPDPIEVKLENLRSMPAPAPKAFLAMYEKSLAGDARSRAPSSNWSVSGFRIDGLASSVPCSNRKNLNPPDHTGFDTFEGFPTVGAQDRSGFTDAKAGDLFANSYDELTELIREYESRQILGPTSPRLN